MDTQRQTLLTTNEQIKTVKDCQTRTDKLQLHLLGKSAKPRQKKLSTTGLTGKSSHLTTSRAIASTEEMSQTPTEKLLTTGLTGKSSHLTTSRITASTGGISQTPTEKLLTTGLTGKSSHPTISQASASDDEDFNIIEVEDVHSPDSAVTQTPFCPPKTSPPAGCNNNKPPMDNRVKLTHLLDKTEKQTDNKLKKKNVVVLYQNMDRLSNKLDRLNHFLNSVSPDIVILSEYGLNNNTILQARLTINSSLVSAFSREAHIKGGVAIFKHINFGAEVKSLNVEDLNEELVCKVSGIKVHTLNKKQLIITGAYRPPGAAVNDAFDILTSLLDKIPQRNGGICLVGDLNIDNLLTSYDITRLDLPPTRFSTSATSIDVVCTNLVSMLMYFIQDAEESRKLFMDAQEKYLRTNKQENKFDFVQKKKAYDLKLRELRRTAKEGHIARTGNKSKAIWDLALYCTNTYTCTVCPEKNQTHQYPEATKVANHALFESRIRYGIILWGAASSNNLQRIMVLQKQAIRVMAGIAPQDSCREAYKDLKILTVPALYILGVILHAHNCSTLSQPSSSNLRKAS
ncbi:hypothetical protein J6590_062221 [Homalodisca vitripennis]|nr:hypothetical protein J6590_062221 [Homalodisca vitripennis]